MAVLPDLPRADDDGVLAIHDEPYAPLGSCYQDQDTGYMYQYLKAAEALLYGDALQSYYALHTITNLDLSYLPTGVTTIPAGAHDIEDRTENFLTSLARVVPNSKQMEMAMLSVISGAGVGQRGIITEFQNNRLVVEWDTQDGALEVALDATTDIEIYADWLARKVRNPAAQTIGFVQNRNGVPQDKYFWALYEGKGVYIAGAVIAAAGTVLTPHATDGRLGPRGASDNNTAGYALTGIADPGAAGRLGRASLKANILVGEVGVRQDIGYTSSTNRPPAGGIPPRP